MPSVDLYSAYGDYADDYCESWAPGSYEDYADDYVAAAGLFEVAGQSFAPSRLPGYPTYVLSWEQATDQSAGADTIVFGPYVQELLMQLPWASMSGADKASLEIFYKTAAVGVVRSFIYSNPATGPSLPVRFADNAIATMPEVAYDRYRVDVTLRVGINYPQMETSGTPAAITGNRFVLGGVAMPFPSSIRPSSGYSLAKPQTYERNSAGLPVIYSKSRLTLQRHQVAMALDFDAFINLQAFFFTFAHGQRKQFTWYDHAETARTVRLAGTRIIVKQLGYNRYATDLDLVEEI